MKKLLIVGDSFCTRYMQETRKISTEDYLWKTSNYKYWFEYLSDEMKMDIVNLSFCGAGNQQIFDNTLYALNTHNDIEFAVICWSEFDRIGLPSTYLEGRDSIHVNLSNSYDDKNSMQNSIKKYNRLFREDGLFDTLYMMDKFINYSITIDNLFKHKNIKNIQAFSVSPFIRDDKKNRITQYNLLNEYMNHELFDKMNDKNFFMFPGTSLLGGGNFFELIGRDFNKNWRKYALNPERHENKELAQKGWIIDCHPNGEGNKLIYETLNNFRLDIY